MRHGLPCQVAVGGLHVQDGDLRVGPFGREDLKELAVAIGRMSSEKTPAVVRTIENSNVPTTRRTRQPSSALTPLGTIDSWQTIDNSSGVRVTEKKSPLVAHEGTPLP